MLFSNRFLNYTFCEENAEGERRLSEKRILSQKLGHSRNVMRFKMCNFPPHFLGLHAFNIAGPIKLILGFPWMLSLSDQIICLM